jgi:hypothetical protein
MNRLVNFLALVAVILLGSTSLAYAQIDNGLNFTTNFAFYVQNTKLPPGSYSITPVDSDDQILEIKSADGQHSALVDVIRTQSGSPHRTSDVTFHKYGNVDYLNRLWVEGENSGLKLIPTKAEKKAAAAASPTEHSVAGKKR